MLILFFISAAVLCIVIRNPVFQASAFILLAFFLFKLKGRKAAKLILSMVIVFLLIAFINPFFNTEGQTVLFSYFGTRPYTLEALEYGFSTATMFVCILLLSMIYSSLMTSAKLSYLFANKAPRITLVLSMVQSMIPAAIRRAKDISDARAHIGKPIVGYNNPSFVGMKHRKIKDRIANGGAVLSSVMSWLLLRSVAMADSMKSRGYGCSVRTSYRNYPLGIVDITATLIILIADVALIVLCCIL